MTDDFAKSILNYFATYTETRFRFNARLPYAWANDILTLDFSIYPAFEAEVLAILASQALPDVRIRKGDHSVALDPDLVRTALLEALSPFLTSESLGRGISDYRKRFEEAGVKDEEEVLCQRARQEAFRACNLEMRKAYTATLTQLQANKVEELRKAYRFEHEPPSTFNAQIPANAFYEMVNPLTRSAESPEAFGTAVLDAIRRLDTTCTLFDLYLSLRNYFQAVGTQTVHLFFHDVSGETGPAYPLFSVELHGAEDGDFFHLHPRRSWVMLNTPAVNAFEMEGVLTTPRTCTLIEAQPYLSQMERFLQAAYKLQEPFLTTPHFDALVGDGLPRIRFRMGLQALQEEDRRLLDYSELLTSLEEGGGAKFSALIGRYLEGNCINTTREVDQKVRAAYPRGSSERLVPKHGNVPLPLSDAQRKILAAVENPRNELMVVDGPPGTGKSYTITALVYRAVELGKSVVITSHKKQALDVIDEALTSQFRKVHPQAKPSVLRLQKGKESAGINSLRNTLSQQAVNAAHRRATELNVAAVQTDRESSRSRVEASYADFSRTMDLDADKHQLRLEWLQSYQALTGGEDADPALLPFPFPAGTGVPASALQGLARMDIADGATLDLGEVKALHSRREGLPAARAACEAVNARLSDSSWSLQDLLRPMPEAWPEFQKALDGLSSHLAPDVRMADLPLACPAPLDPDWRVDLSHAQILDALACLAAWLEAGKGLGGLLKRKQVHLLRQNFAETFPSLIPGDGKMDPEALHAQLADLLRRVEEQRQRHPGLRDDTLLHGDGGNVIPACATLMSLASADCREVVGSHLRKPFAELTLSELAKLAHEMTALHAVRASAQEVGAWATRLGWPVDDLGGLYQHLRRMEILLGALHAEDLVALETLFHSCGPLLASLGIEVGNLGSLRTFMGADPRAETLRQWIVAHSRLSAIPEIPPPDPRTIQGFFDKNRKLVCQQTDERFAGLQHHAGDLARIQTALDTGKQLSPDQAGVLLRHLNCIIAEAPLISRHLPMQADLIDLLIIDEASQVSIADSISLMLRARQTIVFGDELQYGAVGALNVSRSYSEAYFKEILTSYSARSHQSISDAEATRLAQEANRDDDEENETTSRVLPVDPGTREWLKTFSVRTSTLAFAKALQNYSVSLNTHFRSYPEIISYSNEVFYRPSQIELITNRIRNKPIGEVLRFLPVKTQGLAGRNVNLDEIDAIRRDIGERIAAGYNGSLGVICSFKEQASRMEEILRRDMEIHPRLERDHKFRIWFVGDVQGEERDTVYYSFVQDKAIDNADLRQIYPTVGGTADDIRKLKMQRLNVGFSRACNSMVFVHSMDLGDYSDTRLGDALRHYRELADQNRDHYVVDESVFDSPAERNLYAQIVQTPFFQENREHLHLIAQFEIGRYIRREFHKHIPNYRTDFLLTYGRGGREQSLILEYDGLEYHTKDPAKVRSAQSFDREYLEYDIERQVELESYGYRFLRIHKFSLLPTEQDPTPIAVLDRKLREVFA
jgi:hypothetical protein